MEKNLLEINVGEELVIGTDYFCSDKPFEIDNLIDFLSHAKNLGATHVSIGGQSEYESSSNLETCEIQPIIIREETEEEFLVRKKHYDEIKINSIKNQEINERLQYELLKKKYEA